MSFKYGNTPFSFNVEGQPTGGSIDLGDPIYFDTGDSEWKKADSTTPKPTAIYVADPLPGTEGATISFGGFIKLYSSLTVGSSYFLASAGGITTTSTETGIFIGIAATEDSIVFMPSSQALQRKVVDDITYTGTLVTYKVVGPFSLPPVSLSNEVVFTPINPSGNRLQYGVDYSVVELEDAGSSGLSLGFYVLLATAFVTTGSPTWSGTPPTVGIDTLVSSGDIFNIDYMT